MYLESLGKLLGVQNVSELRESISTCRIVMTGDTQTKIS